MAAFLRIGMRLITEGFYYVHADDSRFYKDCNGSRIVLHGIHRGEAIPVFYCRERYSDLL